MLLPLHNLFSYAFICNMHFIYFTKMYMRVCANNMFYQIPKNMLNL